MDGIDDRATPLLDGRVPLPPPRRRSRRARSAVSVIFFVVAVTSAAASTLLGLAKGGLDWAFAFFTALYASMFVHELGHLVCGLACGFRLERFRVWPFVVANDGARPRLSFDTATYGAFTMMRPAGLARYPLKKVWYSLAGSAANVLLAAAVAPPVFATLAHHEPRTYAVLVAFCTLTLSLLLAIVNVVPMDAAPFRSDGAQAADAWRRTPAFFRELALLRLGAAIVAGTPARELDADALAEAIELADGSRIEMRASLLAFARAVARDDLELAAGHVERALACSAAALPSERAHLLVTCAVFAAWHRIDVPLARTWIATARASGKRLTPIDRCRLDIFEPWIEGRREAALAGCDRYLALLAKLPQVPLWQPMRDDAREVRAKIASLPLPTKPVGGDLALAPA